MTQFIVGESWVFGLYHCWNIAYTVTLKPRLPPFQTLISSTSLGGHPEALHGTGVEKE